MIERIDASTPRVRKFGLLFGGLCAGVGVYIFVKGHAVWPVFGGLSVFFFVTAVLAVPLLRPVYVAWMAFASVLGWINTRILLGVFFYLVITPVALVIRLAGKDLLSRRPDPSAKSYWIPRTRTPFDRSRYERMF